MVQPRALSNVTSGNNRRVAATQLPFAVPALTILIMHHSYRRIIAGLILIAGLGLLFLNGRPAPQGRTAKEITNQSHAPDTDQAFPQNHRTNQQVGTAELWSELESVNALPLPTQHDRRVLLSALFRRWITLAPESALEALRTIEDSSMTSKLEIEVVRALATHYPTQVVHWMQQVDFLSQKAVDLGIYIAVSDAAFQTNSGSLFNSLPANGEAAAAQAWVDGAIRRGGYRHAATTLDAGVIPEIIALPAKAALASNWFHADPASAVPWLNQQLQQGGDPDPILEAALSAWQASDPTSAVEWLLAQEPKIASPDLIQTAILAQAHATLRQGGTLEPMMDSITTLPEPAQQDALLAGLALAIDDLDPDTTRSLLTRIDDLNTRETTRARLHIEPEH